MVKNEKDKKPILNPQAEGSNTAANRNRNAVIRTNEWQTEKELFNLKKKVAEKGNNESFLNFEKKNEKIKEVFKNYSLTNEWKKTQEEREERKKELEDPSKYMKFYKRFRTSFKNTEDIKIGFEKAADLGLREIIPFYGSLTKNNREKELEAIIEYYQEQFSQLTTSIANDQENIFSEVKNVLKEKNRKIEGMTKVIEELKEQADAEKEVREKKAKEEETARKVEKEKQRLEKERETEIARLQGEDQKALLSAEKKEIEQLRAERNQLRNTSEEQEAFLTRWVKEYERLELDKSVAVHTVLKYDAIIKQRDSEIREKNSEIRTQNLELEQLRSDKIALNADNTGYKETINNLNKDIKEAKDKIKALESDKATLEAQVNDLEADKNDWKEKYEKEKRQKRIGMIGNIAQGAVEWLPIPEKWQGGLKTSIQAASVWALWKDLPNWTYEGLIMLIGVGLWYAIIHILRKINRVIFGRKEKKQISNLEKALTNIIEAGSIGKNKKEPSSPAVVSKEVVITGEVVEKISSEKTDPIIEEKTEVEKPKKKGKNGKKGKGKKKGKK